MKKLIPRNADAIFVFESEIVYYLCEVCQVWVLFEVPHEGHDHLRFRP